MRTLILVVPAIFGSDSGSVSGKLHNHNTPNSSVSWYKKFNFGWLSFELLSVFRAPSSTLV